ncbi:hypothetical protein DH09_06340 [Bacillaceae bacterium JMAK1]|nr:hypothetical protein DH09_06340 [Bacillaceae bacterium JMAK1]
MKKLTSSFLLLVLLTGCNQYGQDLQQDLEAQNREPYNEDQEPNTLYVNHKNNKPGEDILMYSDEHGHYLTQFHDHLEALYSAMDRSDFQDAKTHTRALYDLTEKHEADATPEAFELTKELIAGTKTDLRGVMKNIKRCETSRKGCDRAQIHTENLTTWLEVMEDTYEESLYDLGITN